MRDRVDGVDLVLAIEVVSKPFIMTNSCHSRSRACREAGAGHLSLLGMTRRIGVDDEGAVHALVDVPLQRQGVAVIEMAAEGSASNS